MVQARVRCDLVKSITSAGFGVCATIHDERQPGLHDRAGTHGTWFQGDIKDAIFESPRPHCLGRLRDGDHLGMGRGVVELFALIVGRSDDAAFQRHDYCSHRDFIVGRGGRGFIQGHRHVMRVKWMARIRKGYVERGQLQVKLRLANSKLLHRGSPRETIIEH